MKEKLYWLPIGVFVLAAIVACTSNPISNENVVEMDRTTIAGQVQLLDGGSPQNVYVWLKGYDLGKWTDENGKFNLVLPADQRSGGGTVQKDTIYFYLTNYFIERAVVSILEGQFLFQRDDIDAEGKLRKPVVLQKFLTISTTADFFPNSDSVRIRVSLEADTSCARVVNPFIVRHDKMYDPVIDTLGAVLIKNVNSDDVIVLRSDPAAAGSEILVACKNAPVERDLIFLAKKLSMQPGQYEIIPYLRFEPENTPLALLEKMGTAVNELSANYLQKPIRRNGGRFILEN